MKLKNLIIISLSLLIFACTGNKQQDSENMIDDLLEEGTAENQLEISEEAINDIIQSIPSPLEIASIIRNSGVEFNEKILNPKENADSYTSNYEKAFNIGVFGGDLGFINMYEESYLALNYLSTIKGLAEDLKVGHFFDFNTIKRLASNSDKLDSLLFISTSSFTKMDDYLRKQKRGNLSVLVVSGAWLEGLYIATQVVKDKPNDAIYERIGEQKMVLDQILLVLNAYNTNEYFNELLNNLKQIKQEYDKVTITYNYREPETKEVDGMLVIIDNSSTEVNITEEMIKNIRTSVEQVRSLFIYGR